MGAQAEDPQGRGFDPAAKSVEAPVREVELQPFFLSKYEMTQGQWVRFTGSNPSTYGPAVQFVGKQNNLLHPVEQVSWIDCTELLARIEVARAIPKEQTLEGLLANRVDIKNQDSGGRQHMRDAVPRFDVNARVPRLVDLDQLHILEVADRNVRPRRGKQNDREPRPRAPDAFKAAAREQSVAWGRVDR